MRYYVTDKEGTIYGESDNVIEASEIVDNVIRHFHKRGYLTSDVINLKLSIIDRREARTKKRWSLYDVCDLCCANNYYTRGNTAEYDSMLQFVTEHPATTANIRVVAVNIYRHSQTSDTVADIIEKLNNITY